MTKARDLANIISTGVPNSLITLDANEIPNISTDKLTSGTLANARVADLPTSKITSGTFADARISASSVTAHVTQTDLKIYFSCNNGGAWTEAASYNAITPVYSTGIKQVRLGETTCTSGTGVIYKAVWANQASGSKETQLHGIGVNY